MFNFYALMRKGLFCLDAEAAHHLSFQWAHRALALGLMPRVKTTGSPVSVMGIDFPNAVGLAAGLDKNAEHIDVLAELGFGFIEVGTVTPKPQAGNPQPRLFRIPQQRAIINRMGFNNHGLDVLIANVKKSRYYQKGGVLGINIGKNASTPMERAIDDYVLGLERVYPYASYVTVNISSPNTQNLRQLQEQDALNDLLTTLKSRQAQLADEHGVYKPVVLKIAPDLDDEQLGGIAQLLVEHRFDGVIATNTTIDKTATAHLPQGNETGGLSGQPLREKSTQVIRALSQQLNRQLPIIGAGGIMQPADAQEKLNAGAQLIQLYSGLIYEGPQLVSRCVQQIRPQ